MSLDLLLPVNYLKQRFGSRLYTFSRSAGATKFSVYSYSVAPAGSIRVPASSWTLNVYRFRLCKLLLARSAFLEHLGSFSVHVPFSFWSAICVSSV